MCLKSPRGHPQRCLRKGVSRLQRVCTEACTRLHLLVSDLADEKAMVNSVDCLDCAIFTPCKWWMQNKPWPDLTHSQRFPGDTLLVLPRKRIGYVPEVYVIKSCYDLGIPIVFGRPQRPKCIRSILSHMKP